MTTEAPPRQRLIEAAASLFHRTGYHAVGVNDLCREADVRKGSFYHFFDSKEALAQAAIEHHRSGTIREVLEPCFADDVPPADRIRRYFDVLADFNESRMREIDVFLGCPFGNMSAEIGSEDELIVRAVSSALDTIRGYFESCLADARESGADVDPALGADALLAYMEGVVLIARSRRAPDEIRRLGVNSLRQWPACRRGRLVCRCCVRQSLPLELDDRSTMTR